MSGTRPVRLNSPVMDNSFWSLIEHCWMPDPFERPTMQQITMRFENFSLPSMSLPEALSLLLATLHKVYIFLAIDVLLSPLKTNSVHPLASQWYRRMSFSICPSC